MKKILTTVAIVLALSSTAYAKQVTTCSSYLVGAKADMTCSGDYSGETTMVDLYKKGWKFVGDIGGTNKFLLVFEKENTK